MALSGVRSSWLILARNCDLCWLASSSWRLLSWISSNSRTFSIDRGLIGEGRDQLDLLVGERLYFRARQGEHADRNTLAQHWDAESCAVNSQPLCFDQGVFWISPYFGNRNDATFA